MKKLNGICRLKLVVPCLFLLFGSTAVAHEKVIVVPLNRSITKISNNDSPCGSSTAGVIRWTGSNFEGCNGSDWTPLSAVPTVYSSGHAWMDRNLGASQVATNSIDTAAYGDLYQWGRYSDGHENKTSLKTDTQSSDDVPGHGEFIFGNLDWRSTLNNNLWQDSGLNNPCPAGFRLPTDTEWQAEGLSWVSNNIAGAFASPLKLVAAGYRYWNDGLVQSEGVSGYYWSSTLDSSTNGARAYYVGTDDAEMFYYARAYGFNVRCLKD